MEGTKISISTTFYRALELDGMAGNDTVTVKRIVNTEPMVAATKPPYHRRQTSLY